MSVGASANPKIRAPVRANSVARFKPQVVRSPVTFAINFCPATVMIYALLFRETDASLALPCSFHQEYRKFAARPTAIRIAATQRPA
jgi:hypothetical protein